MNPFILKLKLVLISFLLISATACTQNEPKEETKSALLKLKEGNERFVNDKRIYSNLDKSRLNETANNGQHPFATIISCSDSRVPVENMAGRKEDDSLSAFSDWLLAEHLPSAQAGITAKQEGAH